MNESKKPADIGCLEAIESIYAWLDNELDDEETTRSLEQHLSHCKSCWSRAEMEKALTSHIRRTARKDDEDESPARSPRTLQNRLETLLKKL